MRSNFADRQANEYGKPISRGVGVAFVARAAA
jgi:hypothetical protein